LCCRITFQNDFFTKNGFPAVEPLFGRRDLFETYSCYADEQVMSVMWVT